MTHLDPMESLETIADRYLDRLLEVGRCACRTDAEAEDAVQDAMVVAAQKLEQFRGDGTVLAWLSTIVVNACRCQARGRKNQPAWNRPLEVEPVGPAATPEALAIRSELRAMLADALETLEGDDRAAFVSTQIEGRPGPSVAAELGVSPEALRARLTRVRRRLRAHLLASDPNAIGS